jgi:16S rRNA (uracil1498-N3)-methyltransferase
MNHQRFFISPNSIDKERETIVVDDHNLAKQISKVLRLKAGDRLDFLDGKGNLYEAVLEGVDRNTVAAKVVKCIELASDKKDKATISVVFPPLRHGRFEWALEKLTELGADRICPVIFQRSVSRPSDQKGLTPNNAFGSCGDKKEVSWPKNRGAPAENASTKVSRWQAIIRESAEQCERLVLPHLVQVQSFEDFLQGEGQGTANEVRLICAERRDAPFLSVVLCNHPALMAAPLITIAVGAEGGFTTQEIEQAVSFGYLPVSLGANILRAETAIVYALAIVASTQEAPQSP